MFYYINIKVDNCFLYSSFDVIRHIEAIDQSLHILWSAPTDHEFTTSLAGFLNYWSTTWQLYASYFHKQWVETCQPSEWALFGRQPGIILHLIYL